MNRIALDTALEDGDDAVGELVKGARAVVDGRRLQAVEFVEGAANRGVRDEVVEVIVLGRRSLGLIYEGRRTGEGIVYVSNELRIRESFSP